MEQFSQYCRSNIKKFHTLMYSFYFHSQFCCLNFLDLTNELLHNLYSSFKVCLKILEVVDRNSFQIENFFIPYFDNKWDENIILKCSLLNPVNFNNEKNGNNTIYCIIPKDKLSVKNNPID